MSEVIISQLADLSTAGGARRFALDLLARADALDVKNGVLVVPVPTPPGPHPDGEEFKFSECNVDENGDIAVTDGTFGYRWIVDVGRRELTPDAAEEFAVLVARAARICQAEIDEAI